MVSLPLAAGPAAAPHRGVTCLVSRLDLEIPADPRGCKEKALGWDSSLFPRHCEVVLSLLGCMSKLNCDGN